MLDTVWLISFRSSLFLHFLNRSMALLRRCIQNAVKHLRWSFLRKMLMVLAVNYSHKELLLICLSWFWIRLCILLKAFLEHICAKQISFCVTWTRWKPSKNTVTSKHSQVFSKSAFPKSLSKLKGKYLRWTCSLQSNYSSRPANLLKNVLRHKCFFS